MQEEIFKARLQALKREEHLLLLVPNSVINDYPMSAGGDLQGTAAGGEAGGRPVAASCCHVISCSLLLSQPQEEIFKARLQALKREEELARGELARLEAEKMAHIRWVCDLF